MKSGIHQQSLVDALTQADQVLILRPSNTDWDINALFDKRALFNSVDEIVNALSHIPKGHFVVMSNGGFDDIFNKLIKNL
jgi:UDP-N-acetylmuramate: L-alanyl-gamma-D-glutamyl-meso-diaminopimelate ligase